MVKIIKNLRNMKILMENSMMSKKIKYEIKHSQKNIIDLSDTQSEDEDECENKCQKHDNGDHTTDPTNIMKNLSMSIVK